MATSKKQDFLDAKRKERGRERERERERERVLMTMIKVILRKR